MLLILRGIAHPGGNVDLRCAACLLIASVAGADEIKLIPAPNSPLPIAANSLVISDINSDHHQDLILSADKHLRVHLGNGSGKFAAAPDFDVEMKQRAHEMCIADVNGDGKLDVVTADHDQYSVCLYLGDGAGKFAASPLSPFWPKRGEHPHT